MIEALAERLHDLALDVRGSCDHAMFDIYGDGRPGYEKSCVLDAEWLAAAGVTVAAQPAPDALRVAAQAVVEAWRDTPRTSIRDGSPTGRFVVDWEAITPSVDALLAAITPEGWTTDCGIASCPFRGVWHIGHAETVSSGNGIDADHLGPDDHGHTGRLWCDPCVGHGVMMEQAMHRCAQPAPDLPPVCPACGKPDDHHWWAVGGDSYACAAPTPRTRRFGLTPEEDAQPAPDALRAAFGGSE